MNPKLLEALGKTEAPSVDQPAIGINITYEALVRLNAAFDDNDRLRGLVKRVEREGRYGIEGESICCPYCEVEVGASIPHDETCPAFHPNGELR